jgi:uncharacterized iron-regulated membrane protein
MLMKPDGFTPPESHDPRVWTGGLLLCVALLVALLLLTLTGRMGGPLAVVLAVPLVLLARLAWRRSGSR